MAKRDVCAIIQARMTSPRLPGKVLMPILGKPALLHQLERLAHCRNLDRIVIATTINREDDPIAAFAARQGYPHTRGSELDVLDRYWRAASEYGRDVVVRITSDCPLIDPAVTDATIAHFLESDPPLDYVSNTLEKTWPRGMDTEVFTFAGLDRAHREAHAQPEREHVTPYFYRHPELFRLSCYKNDRDWSGYRLTLDTEDDFRLINAVFTALYGEGRVFDVAEMVALIESRPELKALNAHVKQKELGH